MGKTATILAITVLSLLTACSSSMTVESGQSYFRVMWGSATEDTAAPSLEIQDGHTGSAAAHEAPYSTAYRLDEGDDGESPDLHGFYNSINGTAPDAEPAFSFIREKYKQAVENGDFSDFKDAEEGETVRFGSWQGAPLEWIVLDRDEDSLFLLCTSTPFQSDFGLEETAQDWATSRLRGELNGFFLESAFSAYESSLIMPTILDNGGEDSTKDKVFILSPAEYDRYKVSSLGLEEGWWLRLNAGFFSGSGSRSVAGGSFLVFTKHSEKTDGELFGVRPAIMLERPDF